MLGGDISNVSLPAFAFDFELIFGIPKDDIKKAAWCELLHMYKTAKKYYRFVPGSAETLATLNTYYHILIVFVGPKRKFRLVKTLADRVSHNFLVCVTHPSELPEEFRAFKINSYQTLSFERRMMVPLISQEFGGWDALKIATKGNAHFI